MIPLDYQSRTRIVFGPGTIERLGELAGEMGAQQVLLISDPGVVAAGHAERGLDALRQQGLRLVYFRMCSRTRQRRMSIAGSASPDNSNRTCWWALAAEVRWTAPRGSTSFTPTAAKSTITGARERPLGRCCR